MTRLLAAALVAATAAAAPAFAQEMAADHAAHAMHAGHERAAARLNLDTPIEVIAADAAGKAVLDADLPELTKHEHYNAFKQMSLKQVANYAPGKLTAEVLAKVEADLAAVE